MSTMPPGLYFKPNEKVKPTRDPSWAAATAPLLAFVSERCRTIDDVLVWGAAAGHTGAKVRHLVAWLSFYDRIHYDVDKAVWRRGPEPRPKVSNLQLPSPPTA